MSNITAISPSANTLPEVQGTQELDGCIQGKYSVRTYFDFTGTFDPLQPAMGITEYIFVRIQPWLANQFPLDPSYVKYQGGQNVYGIGAALVYINADNFVNMTFDNSSAQGDKYEDIANVQIMWVSADDKFIVQVNGINICDLGGINFGNWGLQSSIQCPLLKDFVLSSQFLQNANLTVYNNVQKYYRVQLTHYTSERKTVTNPVPNPDNEVTASYDWVQKLRWYGKELDAQDSQNLINPTFDISYGNSNNASQLTINEDNTITCSIERQGQLSQCDLTAGANKCELLIFHEENQFIAGRQWAGRHQFCAINPDTLTDEYIGYINNGEPVNVWKQPNYGITYLGNDVYEVSATIDGTKLKNGFTYYIVQIWTIDDQCLQNGAFNAPQRYAFIQQPLVAEDVIPIIEPEIIECGFDTITQQTGSSSSLQPLQRQNFIIKIDTSGYDQDVNRNLTFAQAIRQIRFRILKERQPNQLTCIKDTVVNRNNFQTSNLFYGTNIGSNQGSIHETWFGFRIRRDADNQALYDINNGLQQGTQENQLWRGINYVEIEFNCVNIQANDFRNVNDKITFVAIFNVQPLDGSIEQGSQVMSVQVKNQDGDDIVFECEESGIQDAIICMTHDNLQQDVNFKAQTNYSEQIQQLATLSTSFGTEPNGAIQIGDSQSGNGILQTNIDWIYDNDTQFDVSQNEQCFTLDRNGDAWNVNGISNVGVIRHNYGYAMKFDSQRYEHFIQPHYEDIQIGCNAFTMEMWIMPSQMPAVGRTMILMSKRRFGSDACDQCYSNYGPGPWWVIGIEQNQSQTGRISFTHRHEWNAGFLRMLSNVCLNINQWHHIVLTRQENGYMQSHYQLFVNGVQIPLNPTHDNLTSQRCDMWNARNNSGVIQLDQGQQPIQCNGPLVIGAMYGCEALYNAHFPFAVGQGITPSSYNGYMRRASIYLRNILTQEISENNARGFRHSRPQDSRSLVFDWIANQQGSTYLINRAMAVHPQVIFESVYDVTTQTQDCSVTTPKIYGIPSQSNPFVLI